MLWINLPSPGLLHAHSSRVGGPGASALVTVMCAVGLRVAMTQGRVGVCQELDVGSRGSRPCKHGTGVKMAAIAKKPVWLCDFLGAP